MKIRQNGFVAGIRSQIFILISKERVTSDVAAPLLLVQPHVCTSSITYTYCPSSRSSRLC